ncbi:hypothetical protein [Pontibacter indicus]|uniref:SpoIIAA-like n=1 Tax=Pontibacter indicus TaxID=1317125 RepID=A0A1R3X1F8_9BACT|nr:hypothetical protein [Pontibacter indicus]SIT84400.1 hypothetical protein SAMN05444128_1395 [Pontibacter indicus]
MTLSKVFSDEYVVVEANPEKELIKLTWSQHTSGLPLRAALEEALQYAIHNGISRWLFDMRKLCYTTIADQSWTTHTFFPAFDQWKRHKLACLVPSDRLELLPENLIQEAIQNDFHLRDHFELELFTEIETAELWLSV